MTDPITLVVADDHPVVRGGLVSLLSAESDIVVVAEAADGREAVRATLEHRPGLVVIDLRMPVMDGADAIVEIKRHWPDAQILVLTTYGSDEAIVRAIEAGASGYLLKDAPPDDLVDGVRRAARGDSVLSSVVAKRLLERVRGSDVSALSSREIDVLRAVAAGNSNSEIASQLHISQATVKTHLVHVYDKLGVSDRAAAVARAYETGVLTN